MGKLVVESPHVIWWNEMDFQTKLEICEGIGVSGVQAGHNYPNLSSDARAKIREYYDKNCKGDN